MQFCASAANLSTRMHLTPFDARGGHPFAALGASHNPPGGRGTGKVGADGDGKSDPGSVDAAPAPLPEPVPEPFFGLGLLGRLLAAYSRGEKEEDFGNCKCNRRTFHTKEKDKDKVRSNEQTL